MHQILNTIEEQLRTFDEKFGEYGTYTEEELGDLEHDVKFRLGIKSFLHSSHIALLESVVGEIRKSKENYWQSLDNAENLDTKLNNIGKNGYNQGLEEVVSTLEAVITKLREK
jgi:hypothetical protein